MAKKHTASSLDTPVYHLTTSSLIALTAPQRSQREIAAPDDDSGSYQFELSHRHGILAGQQTGSVGIGGQDGQALGLYHGSGARHVRGPCGSGHRRGILARRQTGSVGIK